MSNARSVSDWQRRFYGGPSVWVVFYRERSESGLLYEEFGRLYASREGALLETSRNKRAFVREVHIHTDELAQERWGAKAVGKE